MKANKSPEEEEGKFTHFYSYTFTHYLSIEDDRHKKTAVTATALLEFNEAKTWIKDIEAACRDATGQLSQNAYLIIQLLEKRIDVKTKKVTNRAMLEEDYQLMGYTVLKVNDSNGKVQYGTYYLEFFEGPIYIEELDPDKKLNAVVKLTISPTHIDLPSDKHLSDFKLVRNDYNSYVVDHGDNEIEAPPTVPSRARINKPEKYEAKKLFNFAEFSRALDPEDKF